MSMKHAVLGLLDLSPLTGYDLKKAFDESVNHFWSGDQAQIYRTLTALVDTGLAEVEVVPQDGRPSRRVHRITAAGREELERWLRAEPDPAPARNDFLARVFFAPALDDDGVRELLGRRRAAVMGAWQTLTALEQAEGPGRSRAERLRLATLRNGLAHARAELDWLDELDREFA
ncbi:PadR family transcriptional regulator [Occultella glacieicola]|uniref:PadR family transcriptional regulator n=1 Tax=Occultella glacieicola TaxID=2518684 RepID=A0ABY2E1F9_9MICO|nr:PadR family transcriptional regulator [Occultella glacieicola]TDE90883.1 PadR family transcriptional regulator [Occultella glacieicola]